MSRSRKTKTKNRARSCRNHGGCPWCERGRLHASRVREAAAKEQQDELLSARERLGWRPLSEEERAMQLESNLDDIMGEDSGKP